MGMLWKCVLWKTLSTSILSTNTISNANPMVIQFDELGDLYRGGVTSALGYPITASTGMRLCLNNDPSVSICLSPAGFPFKGDCE